MSKSICRSESASNKVTAITDTFLHVNMFLIIVAVNRCRLKSSHNKLKWCVGEPDSHDPVKIHTKKFPFCLQDKISTRILATIMKVQQPQQCRMAWTSVCKKC